ncbi:MAG TPA: hypothetical protein VHG92_05020 [Afifellaceae bacterium]|nr:hypothetical protein [Afifellaceae bacterium]
MFRAKDFTIAAAIGFGTALFGAVPLATSIRLARAAAGLRQSSFTRKILPAEVGRILGIEPHTANALILRHFEERRTAFVLFLRSLSRGPAHQVDVLGAEAIDAALAGGRGVVLWVADFVYAQDVVKIGLAQRGYWASHLSQPQHGFSDSLLGLRLLNPIRTTFEARFLRERVVYQRSRPGEAVERLLQRLRENGIVSITATSAEGRKLCEAAFLNGRLRLAPGAPKIGYRAGAPVLPVFAVPHPEAPFFRVTVESPLSTHPSSEEAAIASAVEDYVSRLERYVRRWPHLWAGWETVDLSGKPQPAPCPAPATAESST